jgi:protein-tyrosine phosphatase
VAKQNGLDISCQVARRFSPDDFERYDRIYAMANDVLADMKRMSGAKFNKDKADLFLNVLHPGQNKDVPDPWFGDEDGYHEVFALIDKTCTLIVQNYLATQQRQVTT